jgi:5-methylthioadenosine/S-adenosylhomocysteine deaminase
LVKIIENGFVVSGNEKKQIGCMTLIVEGDRILEIGKRADALKTQFTNTEVIDASGKIIFPGFINAHYCGESFILRYLTAAHPAVRWTKLVSIRKAVEYLRTKATYEELLSMYRAAYFSALKSGITTICEFGMDYLDVSLRASFEAMRQTEIRGTIGLHNGDQFETSHLLKSDSIQFAAVAPDEEELTLYNLQSMVRMAGEFHWPLILRLGETQRSADILKKNFSKSAVQLCSDFRLFEYPLHLVNLNCFEAGDLEVLAKKDASLITTPLSLIKKGFALPPYADIQKSGVSLVLASDWGSIDPFATMRSYAQVQKLLGMEIDESSDIFALHTSRAARALKKESEIGTIESGKKADLVFYSAAGLKFQPFLGQEPEERTFNVLLDELSAQEVADVMIGGEFYIREKNILMYSEEDLIYEEKQLLRKLLALTAKQTDEPKAAEVIPFTPSVPRPVVDPNNLPFEEGYRVVKKNSQDSSAGMPEPPEKTKLSKDIRRVFGEDE